MKTLLIATLALFSIIALSACAGPRPHRDNKPDIDSLVARTWTAIQLDGKAVPTEPARITLEFQAKNQITGFSGVNRYSASYTNTKPGAITFSGVVATKMAGPPESMASETSLFNALDKATTYRVNGAILDLLLGDRVLARFRS